ncbi:MAG TPA: Cof-type HAD-IIB family hydrolase [Candidatus Dormibacteraeota bacterium]|nr:Cof-type HAD-IIB family hydrolase [Candidatus Dormibacteraeota bacterium]
MALDLDGTLLSTDEEISPRNRRAIGALLRAGVRVVIVTGRGVDTPARVARDLGIDHYPMICCHGALTRDLATGTTLGHVPVPLVHAKPIVEFAEERGLPIAVYAEDHFWRLEGQRPFMKDMTSPAWRETPSFKPLLGRPPTFIRFLGEDGAGAVRERFGHLPLSFRIERWLDFVECVVLDRDAGKKKALADLCRDWKVPARRVLAIGDSRNDVPMLRWAGIGVVMGNAAPDVRAMVPLVTATNDEDGVAEAIDRYVFGGALGNARSA